MSDPTHILVCGTNWLGDTVMSMPALQALKACRPECRLTMLVTPGLMPLWRMHEAVDDMIPVETGVLGTLRTAARVRRQRAGRACVFPNSFRSALIPFLAGVPERVGMRGHQRSLMLTRVVRPLPDPARFHQAWEYVAIAGIDDRIDEPGQAQLRVPEELTADVCHRFSLERGPVHIGIIPGAAYGPSKRWPATHFIEVGRRLADSRNCRVLVLGTEAEAELCSYVARGIGEPATSAAGQTSLPELVALLSLCSVAITNDSGGMHLAAAAGTRTVAIFGVTDAAKTGPLGSGHAVLRADGAEGSRDIERDSPRARAALASVKPGRVAKAAVQILSQAAPAGPVPASDDGA